MIDTRSRVTQGLVRLTDEEFDTELSQVLTEQLKRVISSRTFGHCMRVSDLGRDLMLRVAGALAGDLGESAQIHVLAAENPERDPLIITSTKLVELRNPLPNGRQRPPLLVFVPGDLKASAEDSFGEATFETVDIHDVYRELFGKTLALFPAALQANLEELLKIPEQRKWHWADGLAQARFLLTIRKNGYENEIVGAALFELGLIPDFGLLEDPAEAPGRLSKNLECVSKLTHSARTERGKVLDLGLSTVSETDKSLIRELGSFFVAEGLENPAAWTARIALDRDKWDLNFNKWRFADGNAYAVQISVEVTGISVEEFDGDASADNRLDRLQGQKVLVAGSGGQRQFKVTFKTDPHPEKVPTVDHFKLQIISCATGAPIGVTKRKKSWLGGRTERSISFTKLQSIEWEEGWHFVRVLAFTKDNDLIPVVDTDGKIISHSTPEEDTPFLPQLNESEQFYVLKNDDVEVEIVESATRKYPSLTHALIDFRFKAQAEGKDASEIFAESMRWFGGDDETDRGKSSIEVRFSKEGPIQIPVSTFLKNLELAILREPKNAVGWRVRLQNMEIGRPQMNSVRWPELPELEAFLDARAEYFSAILGAEDPMVTEGRDFSAYENEILTYAESYLHLLSSALSRAEKNPEDRDAIAVIHRIISLDRIDVELVHSRKATQRLCLLGPTHPLRAIWLLGWSQLAEHWLKAAQKSDDTIRKATREALLQRLKLLHFPATLAGENGQVLNCIENIHPFWSIYASAEHANPKGLVAEFCTHTGISEPSGSEANLSPAYLADRMRRYLIQHPYVEELAINCFNPGRAKLLADTLMELQRDRDYGSLRYDVRLFVPDPDADGIGEELQNLLSPISSLAENADVFSMPTGNHLAPKLSFSIRARGEFERHPSTFPANISLLFDVFPAQEIAAERMKAWEEFSPVHGLFQEFKTFYEETDDTVVWKRIPRHARAVSIVGGEAITNLLSSLSEALSNAAANVAVNQSGLKLRPASILHLNTAAKALLHHVHEASDWVFTVDRNLGIEFFDHGGRNDRPEYLIDHSPDFSAGSGARLVITSRSLAEVESLFIRVLKEKQIGSEASARPLLGALRALSGRLALKLVSSVTQRAEALGLALAKLFLDHQGVFNNQVVVPLDAHLELYRGIEKCDLTGAEVSLKRTDLALFDLNARERTITCRLVEVKCYQSVGGMAAFEELKKRITDQIAQSELVLRHHFDPAYHGPPDRPDRNVKCQEFVALLEFYLDRAYRLDVLSKAAWEEAKFFLRSIESGYRLVFAKSGLVFDFEKDGTEGVTQEGGIEFYRIGRDLIQKMVRSLDVPLEPSFDEPVESLPETRRDSEADGLMDLIGSTKATFKTEDRDRTVDWEILPKLSLEMEDGEVEDEPPPQIDPPQLVVPKTGPSEKTRSAENDEIEMMEDKDTETDIDLPEKAYGSQPSETADELVEAQLIKPDIVLGESQESPQFGILGELNGRSVALDLNQTQTISLFGVQGGGKSYTLGSIIEMATMSINGINKLPSPLASVVFHYSQTQDYKPEFTSMVNPNGDASSIQKLLETYGARPEGLKDVVLLAPKEKIDERRDEYPELEVHPLTFSSAELQASHWRFLMGAIGNQAVYIRQINRIMRGLRNDLSLTNLKAAIEASGLVEAQKNLAMMRLGLAEEYIDDANRLGDLVRPGRLLIVDLRDEFIEKDEALGLFVVILQILSEAKWIGNAFNKLVVFDEAHKYIDSPDLVSGLVEVVREMRHKGTSILVASQDPPSVPVALIELSSQVILHRFNSPGWLKHIQKANASLTNLNPTQMAQLRPGEAYVWSSKSTDSHFSHQAIKCRLRPRVTAHGGATKTACENT